MKKSGLDELMEMASETCDSEFAEFSTKYFGKPLSDLNSDERHEMDCFGAYGVSEWLIDN